MKQNSLTDFDVAVVGGGPAGMMAAIAAADIGVKVILLEARENLGTKLLISGHGRGNITNEVSSIKELVEKIGTNGKFLYSAFNYFGPKQVREFFAQLGVDTKVEDNGRVFPKSDSAKDILRVLKNKLKELKVTILFGKKVTDIEVKNNKITKLIGMDWEVVAKNYIIATGGKSYPQTGSDGSAFVWLQKIGHSITPLAPALTSVMVKEKWVKDLAGLSFNADLNLYLNGKKKLTVTGDALFTHQGLSGPAIINISRNIGEMLIMGKVEVRIDFVPVHDFALLDKILERSTANMGAKQVKNGLGAYWPERLTETVCSIVGIDANKKMHDLTREERRTIARWLKEFILTVDKIGGFDQAMATSGGVALTEADQRTMKSKKIDNLFFAGEILEPVGPTGGYNLQIAWSTGKLAGISAAKD